MITVGVVGLGVIGGSIALAADRAGFSVVGWDADRATREEAGQRGVAVSTDLSDADLVVLAAPLPALTDTLSATLAQVRISGTATVTDVGSLKVPVAAAMRLAGLADRYVGGHPMAGSDRSGLRSATDDLFVGSRWVLCLDADTNLEGWFIAAQFAIDLGAVVVPLTSGQHDDSVALISGVPHLLALALAAAARTAAPYTQALTAGSFADLTRVAGSSPTLLHAVTEQNAPAVRAALRIVLDQLDRPWPDLIEDGHAARQNGHGSSEEQHGADIRTELVVTDQQSLLDLGRAGTVIEAVDPAGAVIRYRGGAQTLGAFGQDRQAVGHDVRGIEGRRRGELPPMLTQAAKIARSWVRRGRARLLDGYLDERARLERDENRASHDELISWLAAFERRQRRDVYTAIERTAADQSAAFAIEAFGSARPFFHPHDTLRHAMQQASTTGLVLEFGVASGRTLSVIAELRGQRQVVGFDSFDGLPERWRWGFDDGAFAASQAPVVQGATIIEGLFQDTLPGFLAEHPGQLALAHIDSDLYSSAAYVLNQLRPRMMAGTVIVFDEYFNYPGWQEHEHRAWQEFVAATGLEFEYLGATADDEQVSVRITTPPDAARVASTDRR